MKVNATVQTYVFRGLTAAVFLLPLITTPQFIIEAHFGKWMLVYGVATLILIGSVLQYIKGTWKIPTDVMWMSLCVFALINVVWSFLGDTPRGLWGDALRLTGAWVWVLMGGFGWWLARHMDTNAQRTWVIMLVALSGAVAGIMGIVVQFAPDVFGTQLGVEGLSGRIVGLFGSPLYLSGFMMAGLWFTVALIPRLKGWTARIVSSTGLLVLIYFMVAARTRGAMVGIVLGLCALCVAYVAVKKHWISVLKKIAIGVCVLIMAWVYSQAFTPSASKIESPLHPARYAQQYISEPGIATRFILWDIALQGIAEKPFFGWGTNMYEVVFDAHYNPNLYNYGVGETWGERVHNHLLENTLNFGLIGLMVYLAVVIAPIWSLREKDDWETTHTKLAMLGLTVSYFGFNMFAFDTPSLILHLSTAAAIIASYGSFTSIRPHASVRWARALVAAVLVGVLWFVIITPLSHAYAARQAFDAAQNNFPQRYREYMSRALRGNTLATQDILKLATDQLVNAGEGVPRTFLDAATDTVLPKLQAFNTTRERRYAMVVREAQMLAIRAQLTGDEGDLKEAERVFQEALGLSPQRQTAWLSMINMYLSLGRTEQAHDIARMLTETNPTYAQTHWVSGITAVAKEDYVSAGQSFARSIQMGFVPNYISPELVEVVLRALEEAEDYDAVVKFFGIYFANQSASKVNAGLNHYRLAVALANTGRFDNARSEAAVALQLDPTLEPQVRELIRRLEGLTKILNE